MTVIGTGIVAGVAQTALQAQQVARQRDRARVGTAADGQRMRELLEVHLHALDEGDESDTPSQLRIDAQLPDHPSPKQHQEQHHREGEVEEDAEQVLDVLDTAAVPASSAYKHSAHAGPLYRHLDVQA